MKELRFYIGDVSVKLYETYAGHPTPIDHIELQESDNYDRGYVTIDSYPASTKSEFLTTLKASDQWINKWYRILWVSSGDPQQFVNSETQQHVFGDSGPIAPEEIQSVVDDIRKQMGDTNLDSPAWTDREYVIQIRFALKQYKGTANIAVIRDEDIAPITLLCRAAFANILSYDYAKYYALQAPGVTLDKSQIHSHYSQVARDLEDSYQKIATRLGRDAGGQNDRGQITTMPAPLEGETAVWSNFRNGFIRLRPGTLERRFFQEPSRD
jgi:hypothetical protein